MSESQAHGLNLSAAVLPAVGGEFFSAAAGGRKAAPLHELLANGFRVPPAFVVPPDLELGDAILAELDAAVAGIGGYPVAARSSGHLEDLPGASFAGQYVTHLSVLDRTSLVEAIGACRASARSPQVLAYLRKNGLDESQARVSVLVQAMVDASVAGVAFSVHPTTGQEDHALIECCHGLGERLVSGHTEPSRYVVDLRDAGVLEYEPGAERVELAPPIRAELRQRILELQAHFGSPQDIEWATDGRGQLWILQSRPVTRIQWRTDVPEFTSADFREGGVSARVCTPLMYSLYRDAVQASMQRYFVDIKLLSRSAPSQEWIRMFYGRPYWSASAVKQAMLRVPGFDEEVFDRDLGIHKDYGPSGPVRVPTTVRTVLPAIPVAIALERSYRRHLRLTADYGRTLLARETDFLRRISRFATTPDAEFFADLVRAIDLHFATESDYFTTIYNNANFQSDLKKLLQQISAATGEEASAVNLMAGLQDVSHMAIQRDLVALVAVAQRDGTQSEAWDKACARFLDHHYFHADVELDISTERWHERPARVRKIVDDIIRSGVAPKDPDKAAEAQAAVYAAERQRIIGALRRTLWRRLRFERSFRRRLALARTYLSRREQMREYSTRVYNIVRQYALEAGRRLKQSGRLKDADDVFMLDTRELRALVDSSRAAEDLLARADFRRLLYRGYRLLEPPGELGRNVSGPAEPDGEPDATLLKGIGCSAGLARAVIRVVPTLEQAEALQSGEILVTRFTDPGWTPVLGLVTGIVTEVGGLLSHAAVIGREYGIPAVLNVPRATQILKTGQRVEIDGSKGTVRILDAADE
jgi:phosphohistidine swiveling domain-containing protein